MHSSDSSHVDGRSRSDTVAAEATAAASVELSDLITQAQQERQRLLQTMKDHAAVQSLIGTPSEQQVAEKLPAKVRQIDTWIRRRVDELLNAETRLDARLTQLGRLESSVRHLTGTLQEQLNAIGPDGQRTEEVRQMVWRTLAEVLDDATRRVAVIAEPLEERIEKLRRAETDLTARFEEVTNAARDAADAAVGRVAEPLDRRIEELNRIEADVSERITGITDRAREAVQTATAQIAEPLDQRIEQLSRVEAEVSARIDRVTEQARETVQAATAQIAEPLDERIEQLRRIDAELSVGFSRISDHARAEMKSVIEQIIVAGGKARRRAEQTLEQCTEDLPDSIDRRQKEVDEILHAVGQSLQQGLEGYERSAARVIANSRRHLGQRIREIRGRGRELAERLDRRLRDHVAAESEALEAHCEAQGQDRVARFVAEHDRICVMKTQDAKSRLAHMKQHFDEHHKVWTERLDDVIETKARQMQSILAGSINELDEHLNSGRQRVELELAGLDQAIRAQAAEGIRSMETRWTAAVESLEAELGTRLARARCSAEDEAVQAVHQLAGRIEALRPTVQDELESAEAMLEQRLVQIQNNVTSTVDLAETQLAARLNALGPRAQRAFHHSQQALADHLARLQQETDEKLRSMTARVLERVEDLQLTSDANARDDTPRPEIIDAIAAPEPSGDLEPLSADDSRDETLRLSERTDARTHKGSTAWRRRASRDKRAADQPENDAKDAA